MINKTQSIKQVIDYWAATTPDSIAYQIYEINRSYSYKELQNILQKYDGFFEQLNIKKHNLFAVALPNSRALLELTLAAYYHERVILPINLVAGRLAQEYVIKHSKPVIIFSNQEHFMSLQEISNDIEISTICINQDDSPLNDLDIQNWQADNTAKNELLQEQSALLMYTSGTTGNPKGVLLSQKNLMQGGNNVCLSHELVSQDIGLCVLPLYHINAQCISLLSALMSGSTMVIMNKFSVGNFFPAVKNKQITWCSIVPTIVSYLLNYLQEKDNKQEFIKSNLKSLKFIRSASSPLPIEIHKSLEKELKIPIIETMGITETAAQIFSNPMPPKTIKIGSVGLPFGNEACVFNEDKQKLPANSIGEIAIKGQNTMLGYYKSPEQTAATFYEDWFLTGDLGYKNQDGYYFITGRKKELIIKGGENISPREIDEVLYQNKDVIEAAAFAKPDNNYGQVIEACVYLKKNSSLTKDMMLNFCNEKLGKFKTPDKIHFVDYELPKGPSGKIQRFKLFDLVYQQDN